MPTEAPPRPLPDGGIYKQWLLVRTAHTATSWYPRLQWL